MKLEEWQFIVIIISTIIITTLTTLGSFWAFGKTFAKIILEPWIITLINQVIEAKKEDLTKTPQLLELEKKYAELSRNTQRYKNEFRERQDRDEINFKNFEIEVEQIKTALIKAKLVFDRILDHLFSLEKSQEDFIKFWQSPQTWKDRRHEYINKQNLPQKRDFKACMLDTSILDECSNITGESSQSKRNPKDFNSIPPID